MSNKELLTKLKEMIDSISFVDFDAEEMVDVKMVEYDELMDIISKFEKSATMLQMYETIPDFKEYVDKFIIYQRNHGNYISPEQAFEYAIVGEYASCLKVKLNLK